MAQCGTKVRVTSRDLEHIAKTQKRAAEIVNKHLIGPLEEIRGYSRPEVATALIMLAYEALRQNRSQEKAGNAVDLISHFAKARIEQNIKERKRRLH